MSKAVEKGIKSIPALMTFTIKGWAVIGEALKITHEQTLEEVKEIIDDTSMSCRLKKVLKIKLGLK